MTTVSLAKLKTKLRIAFYSMKKKTRNDLFYKFLVTKNTIPGPSVPFPRIFILRIMFVIRNYIKMEKKKQYFLICE